MKSPLNNTGNVVLEKSLEVDKIVRSYSEQFAIDVKKYFSDLTHIDIYKCTDTGYRFYYPFHIAGDSEFYIHFQQFDWYYMPWKWEHRLCAEFIKPTDSILEVGCGQGAFLKKINAQTGANCVGLELNESCMLDLPNLQIKNILIEDFSETNREKFDLVCTFQVLEHISAVHSFIKSQVACLKPGGLLVICVPNNDSFLLESTQGLLNSPPHHMSLWNERSLRSLEQYFGIKLKSTHFEPLQTYHYDWYISLKLKKYFGQFLSTKLMSVISRLGLKNLIHKKLDKASDQIRGHSIMTVYEKV